MEASKTALEAGNDTDLRVPCYCEENVWRLAYRMIHGKPKQEQELQYHVVFISNPAKCVPMFQQLANEDPLDPCFWDYHVILFRTSRQETIVMDVDSHLPYKIPLKDYLENVFPDSQEWLPKFLPNFRVIEAPFFLDTFSSDRSHMYDRKTKKWNSPPPPYACIQIGNENNTAEYFTISAEDIKKDDDAKVENCGFGAVLSLSQLKNRFHVT